MKTILAHILATTLLATTYGDEVKTKKVTHEIDGITFENTIVYPEDTDEAKPGILMVPNWMGPTESSLEKAKKVAGDDHIVMMADMYGTDVRPSNAQEAGQAAGKVRGDRDMMRQRASVALETLLSEGSSLGLDKNKIAAIGFCFGGGTVLELGRSGADVDAVVSFHGDLVSPTLEDDAADTEAKVLVLHGADDPYVPQEDVQQFVSAMLETDVDWQLVQYSGTVHSFTNPEANSDGSRYNEQSSERAFEAMEDLFDSIWD